MAISELKPFSRRDVARRAAETPEGRKKIENMVETVKDLRRAIRENPDEAKNYRPPHELLEEFYIDLAKEYEAIPMTKEEIERNFSADNLIKLTLDDYVKLLRRVPPRFVTHVTRQGVRDHVSHHDAGKDKYSQGFEKIVEAGKLQSVLEQYLQGMITRDIVKEVMCQHLRIPENFGSIEEARQEIDDFLNRSRATNLASSEIADRRALHVAMDYVADDYYGGERGNEIFFVYPTAYVAAHNYLAPQLLPFSEELKLSEDNKRSQYNDFWIRGKKTGAGELPVDAAIVFIPERTPVDPETGSRYLLDEKKNPVLNKEEIDRVKQAVSSAEIRAIWPGMYERIIKYRDVLSEKRKKDILIKAESETKPGTYAWGKARQEADRVNKEFEEEVKNIEPLLKLCRDKGIKDSRFYEVFTSDDPEKWQALISLFDRSERAEPFKTAYDNETLMESARSLGIHLKMAENPIPSKEYWEKRFQIMGKPSKVIFYEQNIPNQAFQAFKERVGLKEQKNATDLRQMFSENLVSNQDIHDQMQQERELFAHYAEEVLRDLYSK